MRHTFAPAAPEERIIYGAARPGYPSTDISPWAEQAWLDFMRDRGIERVCCLLSKAELVRYEGWLASLSNEFGAENVCHAPISDREVIDENTLHKSVLPFFREGVQEAAPTVVHCSAGLGRTGHVLALWFASNSDHDIEAAVETVEGQGRRPLEAATIEDLRALI